LGRLDLSDNQLTGIPVENLKELNLCDNQLIGTIPAQIRKLLNLGWLDFCNN